MPEARLTELTTSDRVEIQELIAEYTHYEDNGDAAAWAALYTADGRFVGSGNKLIVGRDQLEEFARSRWNDKPKVRKWTHWANNIVIRPTAEGAEATSYQMVVETNGDTNHIVKVSGKVDELRRENGRWRFYERKVMHLPAE
ncbi:nuclear transport factor 2 family protein [Novosphingobium flavum]|uniref:Nuclear transport factor 2 family protein n=1 Tax=Novosphingobium flavum TaxID=1778672 RepID=A0A7X1FT29_9SPHN|nr:nuclear transport factor 2 family protein [Novosphingobium flavum]MBC2665842.1 nuclear transport factor 2 family protein [Novosphingobium flavum]